MFTNTDTDASAVQLKDSRSVKEKVSAVGNNLSLCVALIAICVVMGITSQYFWSWDNWMTLLMSGAILIIRASGATPAMLTAGMDISQNATGAFAGLAVATLAYNYDWSIGLCLVVVLLFGVGLGAVNAVLVSNLKINALIATIGTMMMFRGFAWAVNEKTQIVKNPQLIDMGRGRAFSVIDEATEEMLFPGVPHSVIIALCIFFVIFWLLRYTAFGRKIYMIGGNENASYLSGINVKRVKFIAYIISGTTAAYAGFLLSCQVGAALPQSGAGTEMYPIAAIVLGGLSLAGGKGSMVGTILGCMILTVINNGLDLNGVQSQRQLIVTGAVLILAVLLDVIRSGALKKQ